MSMSEELGIRESEVCLSVRNLTTNFYTKRGVVHAVRGVSFDVKKGEILGLVGESGSGKSVTSFSVLNLVKKPGRIDSGEIIFEGTDLRGLSPEEMRKLRGQKISMIFQEPLAALNPAFTIGWQIEEVFRLNGEKDKKVLREKTLEILKKVRIPSPEQRMNEFSYQFSGGMRQRAVIAIALAAKPDLMFADEPTTALDVTVQAEILDLLEELQKDMGMSVVFISHNLNLVGERCQRICVMYAGQIVEQATSKELFASPRHPYTKSLMMSMPGKETGESFYVIPGEICDLTKEISGCAFAPRCYKACERCFSEEPVMKEVSPGHYSKCHFCMEEI